MFISKLNRNFLRVWETKIDNKRSLSSLTRFIKYSNEIMTNDQEDVIVLGVNLNEIRFNTPKEDRYQALYLAKIDSRDQPDRRD